MSTYLGQSEQFRYPTYLLNSTVFIEDIKRRLGSRQSVGAVILQKTVSACGIQFVDKGFEDKYLTRNSHPSIISVETLKNV